MGCGAPQPEDVEFEQPVDAELITDDAEIAKAKAGPDVHCPYCEGRNPGTAKFCGSCGGDLSEAAIRKHGKVVGARQKDAKPIICAACGAENKASAKRCQQCGSPLAKPEKDKPKTEKQARRFPAWLIILGVIGCVAAAVFGFMLLSTSEVSATVTAVRWERSIGIEEIRLVSREGWYDDIPYDAQIDSCSERLYETSDNYVAGAVEVCGTEYVEDTGTGHGEVVQVCVYEVYDDWCEYLVEDWTEVDRARASGRDTDPYWPDPYLGSDQRRGSEEESYEVTFTSSEGRHEYEPDSSTEFMRYDIGTEWTLEINKLGAVVSVSR